MSVKRPSELRRNVAQLRKEFVALASSDDSWTFHEEKNSVKVWKRKVEDFACSRGSVAVRAPVRVVYDLLSTRPGDVDESYDNHVEIERYSESDLVNHVRSKRTWPVSARDFCVYSHIYGSSEDALLMISLSCDHEACPPSNDYVRGTLGLGGWVIKSTSKYECHLTNIVQIDLGGHVPKWAVAKFVASQGMVAGRVRDLVDERVSSSMMHRALETPRLSFHSMHKSDSLLGPHTLKVLNAKRSKQSLVVRNSSSLSEEVGTTLTKKKSSACLGEQTKQALLKSRRSRSAQKGLQASGSAHSSLASAFPSTSEASFSSSLHASASQESVTNAPNLNESPQLPNPQESPRREAPRKESQFLHLPGNRDLSKPGALIYI